MSYFKEEDISLAQEDHTRDPEVLQRFSSNLKLVYDILYKTSQPKDSSIDREDLLQEGYKGLWEACMQYDASKGFTFSTYAAAMIKGRILEALIKSDLIKVTAVHRKIRSAISTLGYTLPLTEDQILTIVTSYDLPREQVESYQEVVTVSIDDTESSDLLSTLPVAEEGFYKLELESTIETILSYLRPNHRPIFRDWIIGTIEESHIPQRILSEKYGISRARCNKIILTDLEILREHREEILGILHIQ